MRGGGHLHSPTVKATASRYVAQMRRLLALVTTKLRLMVV